MPDPFITAQDLSDYLGRNVTADNGAIIAIDAACDICRDVAEADFNAGTTTLSLDGTGTDALFLPSQYLPANTAGTVLVNGGTVTDYMLDTRRGMLLRGTAGGYPRSYWPEGRRNVQVTLSHGYGTADMPRSVKMVALALASRLVVQGPALEETVGADRVKYAVASTDLTANELRILRKAKKLR